ncbi:MAG: ribose 5-phosphate isomerase B [Firmicutes bacterium]|nr:ribose 5-phosphate isomerase B [Bacillota bacterium]
MKIVVGSDHGGFQFKEAIKKHLVEKGHEVFDVGTSSEARCNYPDYAILAGEKVASGEAKYGFIVCTTGIGISIAANKVKGVRCAVGYDDEAVRLTRNDNDANMISFGQGFMKLEDVLRRVDIFLSTEAEGGRHANRVNLIKNYEDKHYCR